MEGKDTVSILNLLSFLSLAAVGLFLLSSQIINEDTSAEFVIAVIISTIIAPIIMKPLFKKV